MKNGTSNDATSPLVENIFDLPWNVTEKISQYVPAYQHYGLNRVGLVCKKARFSFTEKIPFEQIESACLKNPDETLYLLSHPSCLDNFTAEQFIRLCACHLGLVKSIIDEAVNFEHFQDKWFSLLSKHYPEAANHILVHPGFSTILHEFVVSVAKPHHDVAMKVAVNTELNQNIQEYELSELCELYEDVALKVLTNEELNEGLDYIDLAILGQHHPKAAMHVLDQNDQDQNDEDLEEFARPEGFDLSVLGEFLPEVARRILYTYADKLRGSDIAYMLRRHPEIAEIVFNTPELLRKLTGEDLAVLCEFSLENAERILKTKNLCKRLQEKDLAYIAKYHESISKEMLKNPLLRARFKTGKYLAYFGMHHMDVALSMLEARDLCGKLNGEDLAKLGSIHARVAWKIILTPKLFAKLNSKHLAMLVMNHEEIALYLIKTKNLCEQLDDKEIILLGRKHQSVAEYILKTTHLKAQLQQDDLLEFSCFSPKFMRIILNDPDLCSRLEESVQAYLRAELATLHAIQLIAKSLHETAQHLLHALFKNKEIEVPRFKKIKI